MQRSSRSCVCESRYAGRDYTLLECTIWSLGQIELGPKWLRDVVVLGKMWIASVSPSQVNDHNIHDEFFQTKMLFTSCQTDTDDTVPLHSNCAPVAQFVLSGSGQNGLHAAFRIKQLQPLKHTLRKRRAVSADCDFGDHAVLMFVFVRGNVLRVPDEPGRKGHMDTSMVFVHQVAISRFIEDHMIYHGCYQASLALNGHAPGLFLHHLIDV